MLSSDGQDLPKSHLCKPLGDYYRDLSCMRHVEKQPRLQKDFHSSASKLTFVKRTTGHKS